MSAPVRSLSALLSGLIPTPQWQALPELTLTDLTLDSRRCVLGGAFIAVPGLTSHGLQHVVQAIHHGARVVLWQPQGELTPAMNDPQVVWVRMPALQQQLGDLANRFFGAPSQALRIAAVTGTNGKSTTAYLLAQAADRCGLPAGYIGTVGAGRIGQLRKTTHTTADVITVHRQLAALQAQGAQCVAMEVSSHALHQQRIAGVHVDTAVFTNLTQDHLDYHHTMAAYAQAKALLFARAELRRQVINADDATGRQLLAQAQIPVLAYTCATLPVPYPTLRAQVQLGTHGLTLQVTVGADQATLQSPLLGRFNAENLLAALGVLLGWQVPLAAAVAALAQCVAPPGRMELIHAGTKRAVIDYAHTPDALAKALQAVRQHCAGRVICVFGCGGDRDQRKRPLMGRVADELADQIILTDDNPRTEDPLRIVQAIAAGMVRQTPLIQRDRAQAIALGLQQATAEDVVLIAGKGHEDYQIIGEQQLHFSDREVVERVMRSAA